MSLLTASAEQLAGVVSIWMIPEKGAKAWIIGFLSEALSSWHP